MANEPTPLSSSDEQFERIKEFLRSDEAQKMTLSEMERFLDARREELMRTLYEESIEKQAHGQDPEQDGEHGEQ